MKVYMFHYVLDKFNYYHFDVFEFEKFVAKISKQNNVVGLTELKKIIEYNLSDEDCIMLTFDDGTKDHYKFVYPILKKYQVKGVFFLTSSIFFNKMLDIHKIHSLLSVVGTEKLYTDIQNFTGVYDYKIDEKKLITTNLDDDKMRYIKQILQFVLPENIRKDILAELVKKYNINKECKNYYMSYEEIIEMKQNGMDFGLHTETHQRLEILTKSEQEKEIIQNFEILREKKVLSEVKAIAYPFGSYNKDTIDILQRNSIDLGFSIDKTIGINNRLEINRVDSRELKKEGIV